MSPFIHLLCMLLSACYVFVKTYSCRNKISQADYLCRYFSFPDSLGDDLIIDVSDSKGKPCGRVVAQVATMAEDPVRLEPFCYLLPKLFIKNGSC